MNKLFYGVILCLIAPPLLVKGQKKDKLSHAYVGAQLHQDQPGFSLTNSFGLNKYLGIGAGVDLTSYDGEILVPVYVDLRGRYAFNKWEPFIFGQFGKNLYKQNDAITLTDVTGQGFTYDLNGQFFYGGGLGASYKIGKVGVFASYTYRGYKYKYGESKATGAPSLPDVTVNANIITAGLVF